VFLRLRSGQAHPATYRLGTETNTLRLPGGPPASPERAGSRWRAGTPICVVSRQQFMKYPGLKKSAVFAKTSPIRNPGLGWLGFCNLKKSQKSDQCSNKDKTYQPLIYVCYCYIGKNYLLFIFLVFLLS
jgi:hypothetical protein